MYAQKMDRRRVEDPDVSALIEALIPRTGESSEHVERVRDVSIRIARRAGIKEFDLARLSAVASLHDIGMLRVAARVTAKAGELTEEEWRAVRQHPDIGERIARSTRDFGHAAPGIFAHHEHWDGSGYPRGIKGEAIPILARIIAIADAYEAMSNGRPYKPAKTQDEIIAEFRRCSGTQFDPDLVSIFLDLLSDG